MAIGAYAMAILDTDTGLNFWLSLPLSILLTMAFGLIVGLPSLRLRADYLAITTIAAAEAMRLVALNARDLTNGAAGRSSASTTPGTPSPTRSRRCSSTSAGATPRRCSRCSWSSGGWRSSLMFVLQPLQRTPWGRVLRAVREDEDAARALGKNAFSYKLQSLVIAAATGALAGFFLALNLTSSSPTSSSPCHLHRLRGAGPRRPRELLGRRGRRDHPPDGAGGPALPGLPISEMKVAALRFIILGLVLILLMAFRPAGHIRQARGDGPR